MSCIVEYDINRISHIDRIRKCYIMLGDKSIGELIHEYSSLSGDEDWIIIPYYEVIDSIPENDRYIPGIDLDLRKKEYIRHFLPIIVQQRTVPIGRSDLPNWLKMIRMSYYDRFEFMCRTHSVCGDNSLYISRTPEDVIDISVRPLSKVFSIPDNSFDEARYGWIADFVNKVE